MFCLIIYLIFLSTLNVSWFFWKYSISGISGVILSWFALYLAGPILLTRYYIFNEFPEICHVVFHWFLTFRKHVFNYCTNLCSNVRLSQFSNVCLSSEMIFAHWCVFTDLIFFEFPNVVILISYNNAPSFCEYVYNSTSLCSPRFLLLIPKVITVLSSAPQLNFKMKSPITGVILP